LERVLIEKNLPVFPDLKRCLKSVATGT